MATRVSRCPTNVSTRECRIGDRTEAFHVFISPSRHFLLHPNCCGYIEIEDRGARSVLEVSYRQLFLNKRVCVWFNNKTGHIGPEKGPTLNWIEFPELNVSVAARILFWHSPENIVSSFPNSPIKRWHGTQSNIVSKKLKKPPTKKRSETIREC